MKAMRVHKFGLETPMRLDEIEDARAGEGEVLIETRAIGAHPVDVTIRGGMHPFHKFVAPPYIPGPEAAGEVVEVGAGVEGIRAGQRVCGRAMGGAYAGLVRLGAQWTMNLPDAYSWAEGAGIAVQFITAWNAVVINGRASAGEVVLVQGGAGGVGMAAIQLARQLGCRVLATVSSNEKADFCRSLGADETINYREEDFVARCLEATGGRGVDVIVEPSANDNFDKDLDAICVDGRIVIMGPGLGRGPEATFRVPSLMTKDARVFGVTGVNLARKMPEVVPRFMPFLREGTFKIHVDRSFSLAEANAAHELMQSAQFLGKLVIVP